MVFSVISAVIGWIVMAIAYEIIRKLHIYLLKNVFSKFIKTITNSQWFRITSIFLIIILAYELSNILISKGVIIRFDFSPTLSLTLLSAYVIFYAFLYTEQKHDGKEDNFYWGVDITKFHLGNFGSVRLINNPMFQTFLGLVLLFPFFDQTLQSIISIHFIGMDYFSVVTTWKLLFVLNVAVMISTLNTRLLLLRRKSWWGEQQIKYKVKDDVEKIFSSDIKGRQSHTLDYLKERFEKISDDKVKLEILRETINNRFCHYSEAVSSLNSNLSKLNNMNNNFLKVLIILWWCSKTPIFKKEYSQLLVSAIFQMVSEQTLPKKFKRIWKKWKDKLNEPDWSNSIWKKELAIRDLYRRYFDWMEEIGLGDDNILNTLQTKNEIFSSHHEIYWWEKSDYYSNMRDFDKRIDHAFYTPNFIPRISNHGKEFLNKIEKFISEASQIKEMDKDGWLMKSFINDYIQRWISLEPEIKHYYTASWYFENKECEVIKEICQQIESFKFSSDEGENKRINDKFIKYVNF